MSAAVLTALCLLARVMAWLDGSLDEPLQHHRPLSFVRHSSPSGRRRQFEQALTGKACADGSLPRPPTMAKTWRQDRDAADRRSAVTGSRTNPLPTGAAFSRQT
jgi:hypothetical protein